MLTDLVRRSSLGVGTYVIREDPACPIEGAPLRVLEAVITAGACTITHLSLFSSLWRITAFPGGDLYSIVDGEGFGGPPDRAWISGPSAVRQVLRLMDLAQPVHRLSGELRRPSVEDLESQWQQFAQRDLQWRIGASLDAVRCMGNAWAGGVVDLPIRWTKENPPPDSTWLSSSSDPRLADGSFWVAMVSVTTADGSYRLRPSGELSPEPESSIRPHHRR